MSNPSLLCVPYRFKTSKLYSQIPDSGLGDFVVTRATTPTAGQATRVNAAGLIELVADNVPRLDYPVGGAVNGCPALLVEPSAVNYLLRSQEFDNASWSKNAAGINTSIGTNGVEANVAISPDGTQNADRVNFVLQADLDLGMSQNYAAATTGQVYNTSIWFRGEGANIGKQIRVRIKRTTGGTAVESSSTITLTSGWVRFASPSITLGASNSGVLVIVSSNDATNALIWGSQLEQGSVPTSYIPTTTVPITRGAETISKTGVSSLIGQTEGTIYAEVDVRVLGDGRFTTLSDGTSNNRIQCRFNAAINGIDFLVVVAGSSVGFSISNSSHPSFPATIPAGTYKIALGYKQNDYVVAMNGVTYTPTVTTRNVPLSFSKVTIGADVSDLNQFNNRIRAHSLYPIRLPNTGPLSLQSLTQ